MSMHMEIELGQPIRMARGFDCPECSGAVELEVDSACPDTGLPHSVLVRCAEEDDRYHTWWQSEWQPAIDKALRWAQLSLRVST